MFAHVIQREARAPKGKECAQSHSSSACALTHGQPFRPYRIFDKPVSLDLCYLLISSHYWVQLSHKTPKSLPSSSSQC